MDTGMVRPILNDPKDRDNHPTLKYKKKNKKVKDKKDATKDKPPLPAKPSHRGSKLDIIV